jgi:DnaJ domain
MPPHARVACAHGLAARPAPGARPPRVRTHCGVLRTPFQTESASADPSATPGAERLSGPETPPLPLPARGEEDELYRLLDVPSCATQEEVKRAWRRLALKLHPDKAGSAAPEAFHAVRRAFATLSDPLQRAAYDLTRHRSKTEMLAWLLSANGLSTDWQTQR